MIAIERMIGLPIQCWNVDKAKIPNRHYTSKHIRFPALEIENDMFFERLVVFLGVAKKQVV